MLMHPQYREETQENSVVLRAHRRSREASRTTREHAQDQSVPHANRSGRVGYPRFSKHVRQHLTLKNDCS
jgi:hypothetical protein